MEKRDFKAWLYLFYKDVGTRIDSQTLLAAGKDSLSSYNGGIYRSSGGGVREMAWPAAIMIGGNYLDADSDTINSSKVSDITIDGCVFQECLAGISSWFWGAHDLTGNVEKRLTNNWRKSL